MYAENHIIQRSHDALYLKVMLVPLLSAICQDLSNVKLNILFFTKQVYTFLLTVL